MKKTYRVLIVDDIEACLKTADRVIKPLLKGWNIEIETAHVRVEKVNDSYKIEESCIIEIAEQLAEPFDLLLLDFSYKEKDVKLKSVMEKNNTLAEFEKHVLNPLTLVEQGRKYLKENSEILHKCFEDNFVNFSKNIYVCTCVTEEDRERILPVEIRGNPIQYCKKKVHKAFKKADNISVKDTREEIFNSTEFQEVKNFRDEKNEGGKYYDFILAKYLEQLILVDILEKELSDAKRLLSENQPTKTGLKEDTSNPLTVNVNIDNKPEININNSSSVNVSLSDDDLRKEIEGLKQQITEITKDLPDKQEEINAKLQEIENQLNEKSPKRNIIKAALETISNILCGVTANVVTNPIVKMINSIIQALN